MKSHFLQPKGKSSQPLSANIFANRSALVLNELLLRKERGFSIQSLALEANVSVGLAHRVVVELVRDGIVVATGVRTAKKYHLAKPDVLLQRWINAYDITKKCRFYNYETAYSPGEIYKKLTSSNLTSSVTLALHSAAQEMGFKYTNLDTVELYVEDQQVRAKLEVLLRLEPRERGYQVLLIEPYYSDLLKHRSEEKKHLFTPPPLLTFLDLYHFPLRGQEQAEALLKRQPELKNIFKNSMARLGE